ncbi:MAG TPA: SDR family NAD(P)-dependent oxidoreductase [Jatrophihabitantaceae bacterium]|jgi:NAD(P)-dependent dehydrogenase (short-subunit alcohol dehydrogenase family)|nr:SDR family NAD(P)-dependent oxidoreductase [Jatrophihabitantaceae bacterium]
MSRFAGRIAVITGAGSGIGRALACQLAADGAVLAISDVDEIGLAETVVRARALGARVRHDRLDVVDRDAVLAYADSVAAEFGAIHLVVNNAGVAHTGDVLDMTFGEIERVMDVNFWGVVNGTKAFLPHLIASGDGNIVNLSSLFGLIAMPGQAAYNASKFAVRGFTEALRIEMLIAKQPVKVTAVHPGGIKTSIARNGTATGALDAGLLADFFDAKLARMEPAKAAAIILRAAAAGRPRILVGVDAWVLHLVGIVAGAGYERLFARAAKRVMPSGKRPPARAFPLNAPDATGRSESEASA